MTAIEPGLLGTSRGSSADESGMKRTNKKADLRINTSPDDDIGRWSITKAMTRRKVVLKLSY